MILLSLALGTDAFSVAVVLGTRNFNFKQVLQLSGTTGLFHVVMPLLGLYGGHLLTRALSRLFAARAGVNQFFEVLGAGILLLIGFYMILEPMLGRKQELQKYELCGWGIYVLAFSVSIDSLAVGISLGMIDFSFLLVVLVGLGSFLMMGAGLYLGSVLDYRLPVNTQLWGGVVLVLLGLRFMELI